MDRSGHIICVCVCTLRPPFPRPRRTPRRAQLHYPDDEPSGPQIAPELFDFERFNLSGDELKKEILHEIWLYHRERMASGVAGGAGGGGAGGGAIEPFSNLRETFQKALPDAGAK